MNAPYPPASHALDPLTSREAESSVTESGKRATHMRIVLLAVRGAPGRCAAELGEVTGLGRVEAARRLSDLKAVGLVEREGTEVYGGDATVEMVAN